MSRDVIFIVEMVFIFGGVIAFGVWELIKLNRDEKADE